MKPRTLKEALKRIEEIEKELAAERARPLQTFVFPPAQSFPIVVPQWPQWPQYPLMPQPPPWIPTSPC